MKKISIYFVLLTMAAVFYISTAHIPPANHPWRQISNLEYLKKLTKVSK